MIKRVISLVLSLVMVLCMMPMNIVASAENMEEGVAANEEEKMLFAAWSDFSNYLYDFHDLPVNMMTSLVFLFGNEENYVVLNDGLSADGCVTIEDAGIENGCQNWNIWPTEMGPGAILYTEDGVTYTFDFTVIEPWEGGDSPEGPGNDVDDSVIRLFARWEDGSGYLESSEIGYGSSSPLVFCFGTYEDHIFVDDLQTTGVATLQSMGELSFDGAPRYDLGVSDLGAGAVQYTHTDGTVYTYSVEGILGYSGDLIAVSTDESRGYKGLIYNTSLPVGDSFEAKFAILNSNTTYQLLPEDAQITASGSLSLEKIDGGLYRVTVNEDSEGQISYTDGDTIAAMYVWGYVGGGEGPGGDYSPEWCQDVIYQGQTVSVFIGDVWEEELQDIQGYGDSYGSNYYNDFRFRFLLGAFTGYETDREALAPAGFYDCISDIYFYLENTSNELGNSERRNCWLSNEADGSWQDCREITPAPYVNPSLGIKSAYTYLRAEAGQGFQTTVCMRFTYDDPSDDIEAATYTVKIGGGYSSSGDIILDLSTGENAALVDTAAELNSVMSSYEALCGWLQTHFPEQFSLYQPGGTITLKLPPVTYEDVIVAQVKPDYENIIHTYIKLHGSEDADGNRTTMPGILARFGLHELMNLDFVYDPDVTYDVFLDNNQEKSYGILADSRVRATEPADEQDAFWNDICNVGGCNFTGFDYAMCSTESGYAGPAWGCTYTNCYYGIYMDCKDKGAGGNDSFSGNTFIGNKFAVCIRSLAGNTTPYSLRVHDNAFLYCHKEFKVTTSGNKHYFYFYRNFYGGTYHDGLMLLNEDVEARGANIDLMDENGNMSSAVVLTDPSRDFSQEGGLWIFGDSTSILNTEANDLLIAENALPDTSIRILDSSEEVIGVWEFEARPAVRSASAEENNFNAGISIVENQDGSLCVAVSEDAQTDAVLHNQMPLLTLDCAFENAAVYYNDVAVASELEEGKISFQVAGGGVYRIVDAPETATYVAAIGEVGYETVAEALDAARTGDVVKLTADAEEADVIVKEGITLDLNSHALTAGYVFAVNGSDIVDSSSGNTGVLVVDPDYLMISSGNSDLPIWNGEGFIFIDILNFQEMYTTNDAGQKQYIFLPSFETIAHQYLVQGMENSRVKIAIRMTWEIDTGSAFQNFVFNDKTVKQIIDSYANGYYSQAFYATITNSEYADFDLKVVLISDTGVELMCN